MRTTAGALRLTITALTPLSRGAKVHDDTGYPDPGDLRGELLVHGGRVGAEPQQKPRLCVAQDVEEVRTQQWLVASPFGRGSPDVGTGDLSGSAGITPG